MKQNIRRLPWEDLTADHGPPQAMDSSTDIKREFDQTLAAAGVLLDRAAELAGTSVGITSTQPRCVCGAEQKATSAMYCDHANEMPSTCPCLSDCYCKFNSCRSLQRNADYPPHVCGRP